MTGQVEAEQIATEHKRHGVVGMRVLCSAMQQDHRRWAVAPPKSREPPTVGQRGGDPIDLRRGVERQVPLGRVLVEEAELVVLVVCHEFRP